MASVVKLRTAMAPIHLPQVAVCFKFPKGSMEELPHLDPLYTYQDCIESDGNDPKVLNDANFEFLVNHIRKGTKGTYKSGWCQFKIFFEGKGINPQWAPVPLIVKFMGHLFKCNVSWSVVLMACSVIS